VRGKILNVSQWIHLRFFHALKIEYQLNLHFFATGRFCRPSLKIAVARLEMAHLLKILRAF
jgi:hypothetical protein